MRRRQVTVRVTDRNALVSGWRAADVMQAVGMRPIYLGTQQAWALDRRRLPDVLAAFEHRGIAVEVRDEVGGAA